MFLPFHFAMGLVFKGLMPNQFSFSMFVFANTLMDVETLYRMWHIQIPIYGYSHTLAGCLLIWLSAAMLGRYAIILFWRFYERFTHTSQPFGMRWRQAWFSAGLGAGLHLVVDALIANDMRPFWPLTNANPLLLPDWSLQLYLTAILLAMLGMLIILCRAALQSRHA